LGTSTPFDQGAADVTGTMLLTPEGATYAAGRILGIAQGEEKVAGHLYEGAVVGQEFRAFHIAARQVRR
jgi:hypothetical protein